MWSSFKQCYSYESRQHLNTNPTPPQEAALEDAEDDPDDLDEDYVVNTLQYPFPSATGAAGSGAGIGGGSKTNVAATTTTSKSPHHTTRATTYTSTTTSINHHDSSALETTSSEALTTEGDI